MRTVSVAKLIIGVSAVAALALNQWLLWRAWWPGVLAAAIVGGAALVAVRRAPHVTLGALFGLAFAYPASLALLTHVRGHALDGIWTAGLLGAALGLGGLRWSLGGRWSVALGSWGLAVALAWPIVVFRETDFTISLLWDYQTALSRLGVPPPELARWATYVALVHLCGVLWIDAMVARYRQHAVRVFEREVVVPMVVGGIVGASVALYQMLVDFGAPVGTVFSSLRRATGLMLDANTFGVAAALSGVMAIVLAWPRRRWPLGLAALALAGAAVWGSSSRTAFGLFALGSGAALWQAARQRSASAQRAVLVAVAVLLVIGVAAQALRPAVGFEEGRLLAGIARPGASLTDMAASLWSRDGYGTVATRLIRAFPFAGIGVGSFHLFVVDFGYLELRNTLPADNAQNWFRHQLAEMGVLGSLGWIAWLGLLIPALAARPRTPEQAHRARAVTLLLVALGLISLVGMPTQTITLAIAFWVLVFWALSLAGRRDAMEQPLPHPRRWWAASAILLILFLGATLRSATGALRVPVRAMAAGWPYEHGFFRLHRPGRGAPFRWTGHRAVAVFPVRLGYLPLRVRVAHPDAGERPVDVEAWVNGRSILNARARSRQVWTRYVRVPEGVHWLMVEVDVSRTFVPGGGDARALGVAIDDWTIVSEVPPDAVVVEPGR